MGSNPITRSVYRRPNGGIQNWLLSNSVQDWTPHQLTFLGSPVAKVGENGLVPVGKMWRGICLTSTIARRGQAAGSPGGIPRHEALEIGVALLADDVVSLGLPADLQPSELPAGTLTSAGSPLTP